MNSNFVRRRASAVVFLSAVSMIVACSGEDKRVKELQTGITRDSAITVIGVGATMRDSFPNIYTREKYLIDGKNYEILYFSPQNRKFAVGDSVQLRTLTPIVFVDNMLVGKGWPTWDSVAKAHRIVVAPPLEKK